MLHIPLLTGENAIWDYSPTIDRVIGDLGYIKGNVRVVSAKSNRIKNNGTADELQRVATWLRENEDLARYGRRRK
ncbi:hypothetical protein ACFODL_15385 [Phenylobacterium terrae]|uniref:Uncharacterized protein n=1 Tax=Phenylobacterium terrae TaxID=2665495 RepID=A0ABW4N6K4_9CAUL